VPADLVPFMSRHEPLHTPGKLLLLFLLAVSVPLLALTWLGWRLVEQDRVLETRRLQERLDGAASLICGELNRNLRNLEELLPRLSDAASTALPPDAVGVVCDAAGLLQYRSAGLVFLPSLPSQKEPPSDLFIAAEDHEYRESDFERAAAIYRGFLRYRDPKVRAAALMRLARCLRKQQRLSKALEVYGTLAELGGIRVAGSPAELIARRERITLLKLVGDERAASGEKVLLASALWEARYPLDQATFDFFSESLPAPSVAVKKALASAEAMKAVWERWEKKPDERSGRMALTAGGTALAAIWRSSPAFRAAVVAPVDVLVRPVLASASNLRVSLKLEDPDGGLSWGEAGLEENAGAARRPQETGLPWIVRVASNDPAAELAESARRRNLLTGGLALVLLVIVVAGYFVYRAVNRELGVARLQSDFVAAVSHEFRTPLTAMCHLTELLEEGSTPEDRLRLYYRALGKESRRLRSMVESLLDFARMEAGRQVYRLEDVDIARLVGQVVDEFREESPPDARRIAFETPDNGCLACADREAISRAVWNLLDNAVKYSPDSSVVHVMVKAEPREIAIAVEDHGTGIPKEDQRRVFGKFVRGAGARALNVKGTGIGLAMVDHIVRGHGGTIHLQSEPGHGSCFTILLPRCSKQQ
jgi:signal transduction histidine kinase